MFGRGQSGGNTVCKFFQQGRCKFGDSCKNLHPGANNNQNNHQNSNNNNSNNNNNNQNRFQALQNQGNQGNRGNGFGQGNRNQNRPPAPGRGQHYEGQTIPYSITRDSIEADLTTERPKWPFSAYGPGRDAPRQLFGGPLEQSPDEMRLLHYMARAAGDIQPAAQQEQELYAQVEQQTKSVLADLDGAVRYVVDGKDEHPNRLDLCQFSGEANVFAVGRQAGQSGGFGQPPALGAGQSGGFGQPPALGAGSGGGGGFGQPSTLGGGGGFGQPSALGAGGAFGQPSALGQSNGGGFGQPSALGGIGGFGQASAMGAKPSPFAQSTGTAGGFGQPSAMGTKPAPFGQPPAIGATPSAFGQPSGQASAFGQPSTMGQAGGFGQPSALGQNGGFTQASASPFAQANQQPQQPGTSASPFAQATQQGPAFGQPSVFGQPSAPSQQAGAFGQPSAIGQQQAPAFGQPSAPTQQNAPFGQAAASTQQTSVFGQPSGSSQQQQPAFGQPSAPANQNTAFGQASAPAQNTPFGRPAAPAKSNPFGQPSSLDTQQQQKQTPNNQVVQSDNYSTVSPFGGPHPGANWITYDANKHPITFKGAQVKRNDVTPAGTSNKDPRVFEYQYRKPDNTWERIWHPNGAPAKPNAEIEGPAEAYTKEIEEAYRVVAEQGIFKDGIMPELPPRHDWIRWDL